MSPQPRVTEIAITRLFNLGNYEHVRYEIRVNVPDTADPYTVLENVETVINGLNPNSPVSDWTLRAAQKDAASTQVTVERQAQARELLKQHDEYLKKREHSKQLLNALGGTALHGYATSSDDDNGN